MNYGHDLIIAAGYRQRRNQRAVISKRLKEYRTRYCYERGPLQFTVTPHDSKGGTYRAYIDGRLVSCGSWSYPFGIASSLAQLERRYTELTEAHYWAGRDVVTVDTCARRA
jgi:hypothetical protein